MKVSNTIHEWGTVRGPEALEAMIRAGLASAPASLEEPWIHAASGFFPSDYGIGRIEIEGAFFSRLPKGEHAWLEADWAHIESQQMPFGDCDFVQFISPDLAERVRTGLPHLEGIRGEMRDAFRWFKLNGNKRDLVWCGMPMNRLDPSGLPYLLQYVSQIIPRKGSLWMVTGGPNMSFEESLGPPVSRRIGAAFFPENVDEIAVGWRESEPRSWLCTVRSSLRSEVVLHRWTYRGEDEIKDAAKRGGLSAHAEEVAESGILWRLKRPV